MIKTYESTIPNGVYLSVEEFINLFAHRIYTEWCLEHPGTDHLRDYNGQALSDFIIDETHYALERSGFRWNHHNKGFIGLSPEGYKHTRKRVLEALVMCAIDFFRVDVPHKDSNLNLRQSLAPYM